jgi:hypothetical protein
MADGGQIALGVQVNEKHFEARTCKAGTNALYGGGFTDATFLVRYSVYIHQNQLLENFFLILYHKCCSTHTILLLLNNKSNKINTCYVGYVVIVEQQT